MVGNFTQVYISLLQNASSTQKNALSPLAKVNNSSPWVRFTIRSIIYYCHVFAGERPGHLFSW